MCMATWIKRKTIVLFLICTLPFQTKLTKKDEENENQKIERNNFIDSVLFDKLNYCTILMNIIQKQTMLFIVNYLHLKKY